MENCQAIVGNKIKCKSQIALVEDNNLVTDEKVLAETFNKFFVNVLSFLGSVMRNYTLTMMIAIATLLS